MKNIWCPIVVHVTTPGPHPGSHFADTRSGVDGRKFCGRTFPRPKFFGQKKFGRKKFRPKKFQPTNFRPENFRTKHFRPKAFRPKKLQPKSFRPKAFRPKLFQPKILRLKKDRPKSFWPKILSSKNSPSVRLTPPFDGPRKSQKSLRPTLNTKNVLLSCAGINGHAHVLHRLLDTARACAIASGNIRPQDKKGA